jgi:hypothetical protein
LIDYFEASFRNRAQRGLETHCRINIVNTDSIGEGGHHWFVVAYSVSSTDAPGPVVLDDNDDEALREALGRFEHAASGDKWRNGAGARMKTPLQCWQRKRPQ